MCFVFLLEIAKVVKCDFSPTVSMKFELALEENARSNTIDTILDSIGDIRHEPDFA